MNLIAFVNIITALLPALNAASLADLVWWTEEELYEFAAEAARLLGSTGVLVDRRTFDVTGGNAGYSLATQTLSTIHVSLDGRSLRGINVQELDARNSDWRSATDDAPSHFATDIAGFQIVTLFPVPNLDGEGAVLRHFYPDVNSASSITVAPGVCGDYVRYEMLAAARAKDSDAMMPDVAAHAKARADLYRSIFANYWEPAE
jgi:hypothetical protein